MPGTKLPTTPQPSSLNNPKMRERTLSRALFSALILTNPRHEPKYASSSFLKTLAGDTSREPLGTPQAADANPIDASDFNFTFSSTTDRYRPKKRVPLRRSFALRSLVLNR